MIPVPELKRRGKEKKDSRPIVVDDFIYNDPEENVPVDYTQVKYVKKPNGARPGMVIFTDNRTVYVTPRVPKKG